MAQLNCFFIIFLRVRHSLENTTMFLSTSAGTVTSAVGGEFLTPVWSQGSSEWEREDAHHLSVQAAEPELASPPMYRVVMLNDDYTPMDFVVEVLEHFFSMGREQATRIMLTVHKAGRANCGVFSRDVAETKMLQVNQYARDNQHPLLCEIEKDA